MSLNKENMSLLWQSWGQRPQ